MTNNLREVDELARDIVRHPHFRSALSESVARRREQPHTGEHQQPQPTHDAPSQGRGDRRFESATQELSGLFDRSGRRSSSSRPSDRRSNLSGSSRRPFWQSQQRTGGSRPVSQATTTVAKQIILLPDPTWASVPRHSTKASLIEDGFVVNAFLVDKQWTARHLYEVFEEAFQAKLQSKADGDEVKR